MKPTIYLKGVEQLEKEVNKVLKEVDYKKTQVLLNAANKVKKRIQENAPVGPTGNLKKAAYAIAYPEKVNAPAVAFAGIRPRKAPHAHLVEFGHGGPHPAPPHPFFRPAVDSIMPKIKEDIARELGRAVEGKT